MFLIRKIKDTWRFYLLKSRWRKKNSHNRTYPVTLFPIQIISVGKGTYGPLNIFYFGMQNEKLEIGDYVSIAQDVKFVLGGNHAFDGISTYPFRTFFSETRENESFSKGPLIIEDDVWIGLGAIILSGVRIGRGAVIGAGSVIAKDIPPYAIAVGNPAKVIGYRFEKDIIEKLKEIDFSKFTSEYIKDHLELFSKKISKDNFQELHRSFSDNG